MKIMGLDMASKTGYSVFDNGEYAESGMMDFTKKRGESNGILFLKFKKWLTEKIAEEKPDIVAYERAHMRGASTEILMGLQTHAQSISEEYGAMSYPIHSGTMKRKATGYGKASKEAMMEKAGEISGKNIDQDDEADAVIAAYVADLELNVKTEEN